MCGIAGILVRNGRLAPELLEQATNSLAHRGPDDSGTVILHEDMPVPTDIGLGNRRLAILDLSPLGHQPMRDPETGNWMVYNGEIYNFREVRQALENEGVSFRSNSDTEVLLKAYGRWGESCFPKMRGMFRLCLVGCAPAPPDARPRSNGHQAALLLRFGSAFSVCLRNPHLARDRPCSPATGPGRGCSTT